MSNGGDDVGGFLEPIKEPLDIAERLLKVIKAIGLDPSYWGPWCVQNVGAIVDRFQAKRAGREGKPQLDPEDAAHFFTAAGKAADPDLQEMFANLLGEAINPNRKKSRIRQDMQTLGALTPAPEAAAVLCYLVTRWPDGAELDLQELAHGVNMDCDSVRDTLDLLVQQRCMTVADDHFFSGPLMIYGDEKGRKTSILVKDGREEFRVTGLGRRIVEMYGPAQLAPQRG